MSTYFTSSKVTITMDASTFQEGLVEMICLSMVPFTSFTLKNKGFQKIVGEMAKKLGVSMGHDAVRHLVITTADSSRMKLRQTLREQLCYLKLDAATRGNKNYLAINLQFYNETSNKSEIKTLDIVDTEGNHNSLYVKNQIKETLKKFDIEEKQILSICVDNAANMTSAVNKLGIRESITQGEGNEEPEDIDENSANILQQWVNDPSEILPQWVNEDTNIQLMRCGIHTLQLAIWDGLKNERVTKILGRIRQVVVKLRTPTIRSILLKMYGKTQSLDTVTRWGSTYAMLDRLLFFKDYCEQHGAERSKLFLCRSGAGAEQFKKVLAPKPCRQQRRLR
ncbi:hypothetical protein HELRODRAFT_173218 [Helobdella robusta]|uniref:DUF4371 domain-containing protein n=1 Tax=Helobdella robusta TaxID=6412 RepID=T1F6K9_HELRO|nr:hypothetical protein HELRODRAFT_173218 [Helobdella robusta]ESO03521.1 hypothetical protein HELRODRAFT_173218 [Helobdella robusta]